MNIQKTLATWTLVFCLTLFGYCGWISIPMIVEDAKDAQSLVTVTPPGARDLILGNLTNDSTRWEAYWSDKADAVVVDFPHPDPPHYLKVAFPADHVALCSDIKISEIRFDPTDGEAVLCYPDKDGSPLDKQLKTVAEVQSFRKDIFTHIAVLVGILIVQLGGIAYLISYRCKLQRKQRKHQARRQIAKYFEPQPLTEPKL